MKLVRIKKLDWSGNANLRVWRTDIDSFKRFPYKCEQEVKTRGSFISSFLL